MFEFLVTIILIIIFLVFLVITISIYNRLMHYKNELISNYSELYILIKNKFGIVDKRLLKKDIELIELVNRFNTLEDENDVINISLELDKVMNKYKRRVWYKEYKEVVDKINEVKKVYNDNVLRFNNIIKMFPISIISNLFGFETWLYYRND